MSIVTGTMSSLLPKLGELLLKEYKIQKGTKGEIDKLHKELTSMNLALEKVSEVPVDDLDRQVKNWAKDVRELSYDIEDAVDNFMLRVEGKKSEQPFSFKVLIDRTSHLLKKGLARHRIATEIEGIKSLVKEASERRDRYKVDAVALRLGKVTIDPRLDALYRNAAELVGIDGPKNDLVKRLMEDGASSKKQANTISIVGFGVLGKTTLASAVLNDLRAKFDCNFFVTVSLKPDIKKIFKNILVQLDDKKYATISKEWDDKILR